MRPVESTAIPSGLLNVGGSVTPKAPTGAWVLLPPGFHHCTRALSRSTTNTCGASRSVVELARVRHLADPLSGAAELADHDQVLGVGVEHRDHVEGGVRDVDVVAIVDRDHIYVADAARNVVTMFDTYAENMTVIREFGGTGQGIGQMANPRQLTTDLLAPQLFVVERDNARVQWWKPGGSNTQAPVAAFGVTDPPTFNTPEGIAVDSTGRIFVSNDSATDAAVRFYDRAACSSARSRPRGRPRAR